MRFNKILIMIKVCIVAVFLLLGACTAVPDKIARTLQEDCQTSSECDTDECCLSNIQPRGRRALSRGTCQKRGQQGSRCIVNGIGTGFEGVFYDCPCASGYYCNGTGLMVINKGELEREYPYTYNYACIFLIQCNFTKATPFGRSNSVCENIHKTSSATLDQSCHTGADCGDMECCVSDIRPLGKRGKRQSGGHCKAMGVEGQGCLVGMSSGKPTHIVHSCPCVSGLTCHGTGFFNIPLGESGKCGV